MAIEKAIAKTDSKSVPVNAKTVPTTEGWIYRPLVDIFNTPDELLMQADLPGADPDQIDVAVESGILTIQARTRNRVPQGDRTILNEYGVGGFHRRFEIDDSIDPENIGAEYRDGVLRVRLPKAPRAQRKRIQVSA